MNQVALTIIIIVVPIITACAAITGMIVGALLVGIFTYLAQKRAIAFGFNAGSDRPTANEKSKGRPDQATPTST